MSRRKASSKAVIRTRIHDWTLGTLPQDTDPVMQDLKLIITCTQGITNLCHDLMDPDGWSGKDPMAYLAECYRINAMAYMSVRRIMGAIAQHRADSPMGRAEAVAGILEAGI